MGSATGGDMRVCVIGAAALVAGCTCAVGTGTDGGGAPATDGSGAGPGADAAAAEPGDLFFLPSGIVGIFETTFIDDANDLGWIDHEGIAYAFFSQAYGGWCESLEVEAQTGACCLGRAPFAVDGGGAPTADHGPIDITGLLDPPGMLSLVPPGYVIAGTPEWNLFAPGAAVRFEVADVGGAPLDVTVTAPQDMVTLVPDSTVPGSRITVTGAAFPVSWVPAGGEWVRIILYENCCASDGTTNDDAEYIACEVEDTGSFTIPGELVSELDFHPVDLEMSRGSFQELSVGSEVIRFEVRSAIYTFEGF